MANYTETKLLKTIEEFEKKSLQDNQLWRQHASRNFRFYFGNQWDEADLAVLRAQRRPALTINHILPLINTLSGTERQNRRDFRVLARRGGTVGVANLLTELCKHALDTTNGIYRLSDCFLDGVVTGKGFLGFDIDFTADPDGGDLVIEKISPFDILEDRESDNEYDLNASAKFVIRRRWVSRRWLELKYPSKRLELRKGGLDLRSEENADERPIASEDLPDHPDKTHDYKFRWQMRECWWKEYERVRIVVDRAEKTHYRLSEKNFPLFQAAYAAYPGRFRLVTRVVPRLRLTVTVGSVVLEDTIDPLGGITMFPIVRFCPYMIEDSIMGVVDNLIDPQQEVNKRSSQALHHLNQSANSGWIGDDDALSEDGWKDLEEFGSSSGRIVRKRPGKELQRIQPGSISTGHLTLVEQSHRQIKEISGVNSDLMGHNADKSESGRAMAIRQRAGLLVTEILFDNFTQTQQIFGQTLCELIRAGRRDRMSLIYSDEEIAQIVEDRHLEVDLAALRDFRTGRYQMTVAESQNSPTIRMANFEQTMAMMQAGIRINPVRLVEQSDLPNKDEIAAEIRATQAPQGAAAGDPSAGAVGAAPALPPPPLGPEGPAGPVDASVEAL